MLRYSSEILSISNSVGNLSMISGKKTSLNGKEPEQDEFDLKLSQNYPASYSRIARNLSTPRTQQSTFLFSNATDCYGIEDSNSNKSSLIEETKHAPSPSVISP